MTREEKGRTRMSAITLVLMLAEVYSYLAQSEGVEYRLNEPGDFLSPRALLCLFRVHTLAGLAAQLGYLLVIMLLAESVRGSVFYLPEAVAKVLLINGASTALYWLLGLFRASSGIDPFLELQAAAPVHGFGFLCATETVQAAGELLRGPIGRSHNRLKLLGLLCLLGLLTFFYYFRLPFLAASGLGFLLAFNRLSLSARLQRSKLLKAIDWRLGWAQPGLFVRGKTPEPVRLAAPEPLELRVGEEAARGEGAEPADDDDTRSRHEEINISDYVPATNLQPRDVESFEI